MVTRPAFKAAFLAPKYWLTWVGVFFLYALSWLPFTWQLAMGRGVGRLVHKFMKKRRHIADVNLKLCFPDLTEQQRADMVLKNMENTGIAMFESGMAWWWPHWRMKRVFGDVTGLHHVDKAVQSGKGVLLLVPHMLHLEMAGRIMGMRHPGVGFYRPHNNALMEFFQTRGRLRTNEYLIGKRDVKGLLKALKDKKLCYYLPDQDYGRNRCEFVPFFAVKDTATTTGTLLFSQSEHAETLWLMTERAADNKYYLRIQPALTDFPSGDDAQDVRRVNECMEQAIQNAPEQYMWLHRRFKTRPDPQAPSYY